MSNFYVLLPLMSLVLCLFLWTYIFATKNKTRAIRAYLLFVAGCGLWSLADFFTWSPALEQHAYLLLRLQSPLWFSLTVLYMYVTYAIINRPVDIWAKLFIGMSVVTSVVSLSTKWIVADKLIHHWGVVMVPGPLFYVALVATILMPGFFTIGLLYRQWRKTTGVKRRQVTLFAFGIISPWILSLGVNLVLVIVLGFENIPSLGSTGGVFQVIFIFSAISRYRFMDLGINEVAFDLFSNSSDGIIIIDEHHVIKEMNSVAQSLLLNKKPVGELISAHLPSAYQSQMESETLELTLPNGNMAHRVLLSQTNLKQGGFAVGKLLILRDITDLVSANLAIEKSEQRFQDISRSMGDWIWETNALGEYTYASKNVKDILGCKPSELLGKTIQQVIAVDQKQVLHQLTQLWTNKTRINDLVSKCTGKNEQNCYILTNGVPIFDEDKTLIGYRGVHRDITDKVLSDQKQVALETEIQQQQDNKMIAMGQLASGIVHNFNNLLGAIAAYVGILRRRLADDEKMITHLNAISDVIASASDMSKQLLSFSRSSGGTTGVFDFHDCVQKSAGLIRTTISRSIEIEVQLNATHYMVKGDAAQIESSLLNLAINARDAMPKGGRLLIATQDFLVTEKAPVSDLKKGAYIELLVQDNGTGMDPATQKRVFEPFFTTKPEEQGTGLGLASVYGTVKQHQGQIFIDSEVNRGTSFKIVLPVVVTIQNGKAQV